MTKSSLFSSVRAIFTVLVVILLVSACDDDNPTNPTVNTGVVSGTVFEAARTVLPGVTVSIGTQTTETDADGKFFIYGVNAGTSVIVDFEKEGYIANQKVITVNKDKTTYIDSTLRIPLATTFASTVGAMLVDGYTEITIPENAFMVGSTPFTGNVRAEYRYYDPTNADNLNAFPGSFSGVQTDGTETMFESYGYISASFTDAQDPDRQLQLAAGKTASILSYIPTSLLANAPATIPMWYYNESTGKWKEDGVATKVGNYYQGEVTHFSYWNFDHPIVVDDQSTLTGRVVSAESKAPILGAQVVATGVDYAGYTRVYSDAEGLFSITVKASAQVTIKAYSGINSSPVSPVINTPVSGGTQDVGDISIPDLSFTLTGKLVDTSNQPISAGYGQMTQVNPPDGVNPFNAWIGLDANGNFSIQEAYSGSLTSFPVQFSINQRGNLYSSSITFTVPQPGQVYNFGTIVMREGGKLNGRAKDHLGNWIADSWVSFMQEGATGEGNHVSGSTDANGYFTLTGPPSTNLTNMRGSVYVNQTNLVSPLMSLNFPASGQEGNIGTVIFSPQSKR